MNYFKISLKTSWCFSFGHFFDFFFNRRFDELTHKGGRWDNVVWMQRWFSNCRRTRARRWEIWDVILKAAIAQNRF